MNEREIYNYNDFYKFYGRLLRKNTKSCFERDVIRRSKEYLWHCWCELERKRLKDQKGFNNE